MLYLSPIMGLWGEKSPHPLSTLILSHRTAVMSFVSRWGGGYKWFFIYYSLIINTNLQNSDDLFLF